MGSSDFESIDVRPIVVEGYRGAESLAYRVDVTVVRGNRTHRFRARALVSVAVLLPIAFACARPGSRPADVLVLMVDNQIGRTISEIWRKDCGDANDAYELIEASKLRSGEARGLVLPPNCVDLVAYDERGRVVGQQRGLTMLPGASWVLRR